MTAGDALNFCRSYLFVPGSRPDRFAKAFGAGADAVIFDLEDAVAPGDKDKARAAVCGFLEGRAAGSGGTQALIRLNSLRSRDGLKDCLAVLQSAGFDGLLVPKVSEGAELRILSDLMDEFGRPSPVGALIETSEGLERVMEIASATPRLRFLMFGGADLSADLGVPLESELLRHARERVVLAAARFRLGSVEMPWLDLSDADGFGRDLERSFGLGFSSRAAIHPNQIEAIHKALRPDARDIAWATRVVAAFGAAGGGAVALDGKLVEKPVVSRCQRILQLAAAQSSSRSPNRGNELVGAVADASSHP